MSARSKDKLSAAAVRSAVIKDGPYKLFDGGGLFLHVQPGGKYWRLKYRYAGREKLLALGVYPKVSLKQARRARDDAHRLLSEGTDPSAYKRAQKAALKAAAVNSFEAVAREWWEEVHRHRAVPEHAQRNIRRLELHIFPKLGTVPLQDVSPRQLLDALRQVEGTQHIETARRLRSLCGQIFRYGIATEKADRDVAADLRDALKVPETRHHAALIEPDAFAGLLRSIYHYGGQPTTQAALRLAPLVFVRPSELRKAWWEDFDLDGGEWQYRPGKGGAPLVTPLPRQAVEILREVHDVTGPEGYVFPSLRGKGRPMSANTLSAALHQMGYQGTMTAHGFRAAARTMLTERLNFSAEWVEMQLGHTVKDANGRAYNRTTFLEQRRKMLQEWANYLDTLRKGGVGDDTQVKRGHRP